MIGNKLLLPVLAVTLLALANFTPPPTGPCDSPVVGGHTGAPGETSCAGCHGGTANTGPGSLTLELSDPTLKYTPGEIFDGTVTLRQAGREKFGFSGLALKNAGNTTIGTFSIDDAVRTRTYSDGSRKYVSHTPCGADAMPADSLSWTFHWKAPATDVGPITLYIAGLAANHNHALSGDDTYTLTVQLLPDSVILGQNHPAPASSFRLWPNPATDRVEIIATGGSFLDIEIHTAEIVALDGRSLGLKPVENQTIDLQNIPAGIYLLGLRDRAGNILGTERLLKY
jgi:hypothetical protein